MLKESVHETLPALATVITDRDERARVFSAPETAYYRESTGSLDRLVDEAPLVRVTFTGGRVTAEPCAVASLVSGGPTARCVGAGSNDAGSRAR